MKNWYDYKKEITLLTVGILLVLIALSANLFYPSLSVLVGSKHPVPSATPTPTPDPSKDFASLDRHLDYLLPALWQKSDHIDSASGADTYIKLTTPDFNSPQPGIINSGVGILIARSYDLSPENTLQTKLNQIYDFDTYNVTPITINGKKAMTMHQDKNGHHRLVYIAAKTHLWEITITSKSLEDEQKYQGEIESFLNSLQFKN